MATKLLFMTDTKYIGTVMNDYDGVHFGFSTSFKKWADTQEGRELEIIDNWYFYRRWGWHDEKFVAELKKFAAAGGFTATDPLPGSKELMQDLASWGLEVVVVTDRPEEAHEGTREWTARHFPEVTDLMFSRDKTVFMEGRPGPFWAIDDKVENVEALLAVGVNAWCLDRLWNQHAEHLPRVHSLAEFGEKVWADIFVSAK